jgi:glycosyltransferase involved in cell wall biosynthesis
MHKSAMMPPPRPDSTASSGTRLTVAMTTPRFLPDLGGVENHVLELAHRLPAYGIDVVVLTTGAERGLPRFETLDGIRVIRLRAWPRNGDLAVAPGLPRALGAQRADIVHVQSYHTAMAPLAMATALASKRPYVVTFHGGGHSSALRSRIRPAQMRALGPLLRRSRRLIATARFEIEEYGSLLGLGPEHFSHVPNGSDLEPLEAPPVRDPELIVSTGRLERYKGHHRAIEALPHVLTAAPGARLWIAGEGPYESELRALAARLGVSSRVEIRAVPGIDRGRFAYELSRARVAVLLSEFETHPMAALEAAALGLGLVVVDSSGLSELVQDGLATGIPPAASARVIGEAIVDMMRRPAPTEPPEVPTWDDCAEKLVAVYRSIVGKAPCASS